MHSHPAAESLLWPLARAGPERVYKKTKQSTSIKYSSTWFLNSLDFVQCGNIYIPKSLIKLKVIILHCFSLFYRLKLFLSKLLFNLALLGCTISRLSMLNLLLSSRSFRSEYLLCRKRVRSLSSYNL